MEHVPHRRKSTHVLGFDYASPGSYFVTLVTKDRLALFGSIDADGRHHLSHAGHMLLNAWLDIPNTEPWATCDEVVTMPDHLHGILTLGSDSTVHHATTLGAIAKQFKTITTHLYGLGVRELGWPPYNGKLWQMNYYERIIRNDKELENIRRYVIDNPRRWVARRTDSY